MYCRDETGKREVFTTTMRPYFYTTQVIKPIEEVVIPVIQKAPTEVQPIQTYVTSCV